MTKGLFLILTLAAFILCAIGIGALVIFPSPWNDKNTHSEVMPRVVIPRNINLQMDDMFSPAELLAQEHNFSSWAPLNDGEVLVSVLTGFYDGGFVETQFIAFRNLLEIESPIYLSFIDYNEESRSYQRVWTAATAATRPGTVRLFTQDLLGDLSVNVILTGLNSLEEHTLTAFRLNPRGSELARHERFSKIAEIRIDGSITLRELDRTRLNQFGPGWGGGFTISAFGRDFESPNILDQIETVYAFNESNRVFEQRNMVRIPGSQVEQRRVRELLGNRPAFEDFITGLWHYVTPQGHIDRDQYIYFNPASREIIFYGDGTQQVFNWRNSTATRYGLFVNTQNRFVSSLRRSIDIELESLDSIRIRVNEDIRLRIRVSAPWDGSYRKASPIVNYERPSLQNAHINARYDSQMGRIHFEENGTYMLNSGHNVIQGHYAFVIINNYEMLELRPNGLSPPQRETFIVESEHTDTWPRRNITLHQARVGVRGIEKLNERALLLTLIGD
jgi:hypothetical protein